MHQLPNHIIVIGGSAGSLVVIKAIVNALPAQFNAAIILVIHRPKNIPSALHDVLSQKPSQHQVREPEDKECLCNGNIYLAPQKYHLLFEQDGSVSLDVSELVHHSRPAIDVSFESAGYTYGKNCTAILLSGANSDGALGLLKIKEAGGTVLVQSLATAAFTAMPEAAIALMPDIQQLSPTDLTLYIRNLLSQL
ncbi:MAG TPA: chemotaxis protein CheB [Chitinophagaceae bacterium]|nr:chemotaxis protein CheB [Chitinophagaceae bacterium]